MENVILAVVLCVISVIIINFFQLMFTKADWAYIESNNVAKYTASPQISITNNVNDKELIPEIDKDLLLIEAAMLLILEHYSDPCFNTEKLASMVNSSPRSLQRKFKLICQSSPSKEIKKYRLEHAVKALDASHKIKRVVFESGFSSPSYFCKCFKEHFGSTPSEYLLKQK